MLRLVAAHVEEWGYPPSVRELMDSLGVRSTNQVVEMLRALERKGLMRRSPRSSRAISLTFAGREAIL